MSNDTPLPPLLGGFTVKPSATMVEKVLGRRAALAAAAAGGAPKCEKCGEPKTAGPSGKRFSCIPCRKPMAGPKRAASGTKVAARPPARPTLKANRGDFDASDLIDAVQDYARLKHELAAARKRINELLEREE